MLRMSVIERLTKRQAAVIAHMQLDVNPAKGILSTLNHLDEILTEYELHDWMFTHDYKGYYRCFYQNVKSLMALSRCSAFILDK